MVHHPRGQSRRSPTGNGLAHIVSNGGTRQPRYRIKAFGQPGTHGASPQTDTAPQDNLRHQRTPKVALSNNKDNQGTEDARENSSQRHDSHTSVDITEMTGVGKEDDEGKCNGNDIDQKGLINGMVTQIAHINAHPYIGKVASARPYHGYETRCHERMEIVFGKGHGEWIDGFVVVVGQGGGQQQIVVF